MTVAAATLWGEQQAHSRTTWETPPGSNVTTIWDDYHAITGQPAYQRQPWCGAELIDIAFHGGLRLPPTFISVYLAQQWAETNGRWSRGSAGVREGDALVIGGPGEHIEYARSAARPDGSVEVQGGNTSPGAEGSQFDGGTVAIKERSAAEIYGRIRLFDMYPGGTGRPQQLTHQHKVEPQYRHEAPTGDLHQWETGPRTEHLQQLLGIPADGYYGTDTTKALAAFQIKHPGHGMGGRVATPDVVALLARHGKPKRTYPTLRPGDKGGMVRVLQRRLNAVVHAGLRVDGDFGPATATAVKRLRQLHGLIPANRPVAGRGVWKVLSA